MAKLFRKKLKLIVNCFTNDDIFDKNKSTNDDIFHKKLNEKEN